MTKVLESGTYIISSKQGGAYVGRNVHEDLSLRPKAVISLPQGVQAPHWIVEKLPNDQAQS
ncbi:hypothetical protein BD779DRAFT_1675553 [Infundibulicybe gibba]|nr:hypothetical protein BD779DRAFT_1675553 [Infundibulicybe gibba]